MFYGAHAATQGTCPSDHKRARRHARAAATPRSSARLRAGQQGGLAARCHKCQGMFDTLPTPTQGTCPADGKAQVTTVARAAITPSDLRRERGPGQQGVSSWCHKCQGMFYKLPTPPRELCPADGKRARRAARAAITPRSSPRSRDPAGSLTVTQAGSRHPARAPRGRARRFKRMPGLPSAVRFRRVFPRAGGDIPGKSGCREIWGVSGKSVSDLFSPGSHVVAGAYESLGRSRLMRTEARRRPRRTTRWQSTAPLLAQGDDGRNHGDERAEDDGIAHQPRRRRRGPRRPRPGP